MDGGFPSRSDTATVSISVIRNLFSPVFNHSVTNVQVTIFETAPVGTLIYDLDAYDNDRQVKTAFFYKNKQYCRNS